MNVLAVSSIDWEAVGHWSTLAQGLFAFLTFVATVVYVGFTYHIMKWAVGQGKAGIELANLTIADAKRRRERLDETAAAFVLDSDFGFAVTVTRIVDAPSERLAERLAKMEKFLDRFHREWAPIASTDIDNRLLDAMDSLLQVTGNLAEILQGAPYTESFSRAEFVRDGILPVCDSIAKRWSEALRTQSEVLKKMKPRTIERTTLYYH
jgi:hypothetical protein